MFDKHHSRPVLFHLFSHINWFNWETSFGNGRYSLLRPFSQFSMHFPSNSSSVLLSYVRQWHLITDSCRFSPHSTVLRLCRFILQTHFVLLHSAQMGQSVSTRQLVFVCVLPSENCWLAAEGLVEERSRAAIVKFITVLLSTSFINECVYSEQKFSFFLNFLLNLTNFIAISVLFF